MATNGAPVRHADSKRLPPSAVVAWTWALLCAAAVLYFLFVHVTPHTQPAALGQPRCGSAASPGPDYTPDGDCDRIKFHRYAAAGLSTGFVLLVAAGLEETVRHRRRRRSLADSSTPDANEN